MRKEAERCEVPIHWRRKREGAGGCPPERWTQGAAPPYKLASMGVGNKVCNKTASGYPQWYGTEAHRVFAPAPRRTATVVQGKHCLALGTCPDCTTRGGVACVVQLHSLAEPDSHTKSGRESGDTRILSWS